MDDTSLSVISEVDVFDFNRARYATSYKAIIGDDYEKRQDFLDNYGIFVQHVIREAQADKSGDQSLIQARIAERLSEIRTHFEENAEIKSTKPYPSLDAEAISSLLTPNGLKNHLSKMDEFLFESFQKKKNADAEAAFMNKMVEKTLLFDELEPVEKTGDVLEEKPELDELAKELSKKAVKADTRRAFEALEAADPAYIISSRQFKDMYRSMWHIGQIGQQLHVFDQENTYGSFANNVGFALFEADEAEEKAAAYTTYKRKSLGKKKPNSLETKRLNAAEKSKTAAVDLQKYVWNRILDSVKDKTPEEKFEAIEEFAQEGDKVSKKKLARLMYFKVVRSGIEAKKIGDIEQAISFDVMNEKVSEIMADPVFQKAADFVIKNTDNPAVNLQEKVFSAYNDLNNLQKNNNIIQENEIQNVNDNLIHKSNNIPSI